MKANLKKMLSLTALGMTLLTNTAPTWAGSAGGSQVQIFSVPAIPIASGTMTRARYSTDSRQYIGCRVSAYSNGSRSATCAAQTSTDNTLYCSTNDLKLIERIQKMTDSSFIEFGATRSTAACTRIIINNSSSRLK